VLIALLNDAVECAGCSVSREYRLEREPYYDDNGNLVVQLILADNINSDNNGIGGYSSLKFHPCSDAYSDSVLAFTLFLTFVVIGFVVRFAFA
jgi:hypothetical protein